MTTQMAELAHQLQTEHKRLEAAHDSLRAAVEALHQDTVKQCLRAGLPPHIHSAEHLADRVLELQKLLATSERLRKLEAQAVAVAIRAPDGPLRVPNDLVCALRAFTLPEDYLPVVDRICVENDELNRRCDQQSEKMLALANENHLLAAVLKRYDEDRRGDGFRLEMQRIQDELTLKLQNAVLMQALELACEKEKALTDQLAAARVAVERWPELDCASWCSDLRCTCGAEDQNLTRAAARLALGLEVTK